MYRIRFHGRGGQGMKTASRLLGTAFFLEGYEVQDAPRYGAERRGAPVFAYVRASHKPINERGVILRPDLIVVADDSLVPLPAAGLLVGADEHTVLLIYSNVEAATWKSRLNFPGVVLTIPVSGKEQDTLERRYVSASCAGASARLSGVISQNALDKAIRDELGSLGETVIKKDIYNAMEAYDFMADHEGVVIPGKEVSAKDYQPPGWMELPLETSWLSAPAVHGSATSVQVKTGLWRTMRPVIDYERCNRCWWICGAFCPDGVIDVDEKGYPQIDYDHCKGCLICAAQCPPHAISVIPEGEAQAKDNKENQK